jgi:HK97 family phage major capsid protein
VLFGALQKYIVRECISLTLLRLDERYADFHQVAFLGYARADGNLLNAGTNPVKYLAYTT